MICLNSQGLPLIEELKDLRAITLQDMKKEKDIIEELREDRKKRLEELKEAIAEYNPEALLADGLDDAIMGYDTKGRVIYSVGNIIDIFVERDGMSYEDASEHFSFNVEGAYVGEYTPIFMYEE